MNCTRNQKFLVILLAGMAISISSFGNTGRSGHADFSSYDDGDDDGGEMMAAPPGDIDDVVRQASESTTAGPIAIHEDEKNVVTADATKKDGEFTAQVVANPDQDNEVRATVTAKNERDLRAKIKRAQDSTLKRSKSKKERMAQRKKDKAERKKKIANCELDTDGKTEIDESDSDAKLACFKDRLTNGDLSSKEKKSLEKVMKAYVQKLEAPALQALMQNDPTGANASSARATLMGLQQQLGQYGLSAPFAAELNLGIQAANYRAMPNQQALTRNWLMTREAAQIAMNPNMSAAQKAQLQQSVQNAMTQVSLSAVNNDLGMRGNLVNGLSSTGNTNPMLAQAIGATINSLGQDAQHQMASNAAVNRAYSGLINPSMSSTAMNIITGTDTYGLNNMLTGSALNLAYGADGISTFDPNSIWSTTNNAFTNPGFLSTTTVPSALNTAVKPMTNPVTKTALNVMTLPR